MDKPLTEEQVRDIATEVFQNLSKQSQFNVANVPAHTHNQIDSPRIPPTSVTNFVALPSQNKATSAASGVLSTTNIGVSTPPYGIVYPVPVIEGYGVGGFSQFNGGTAPKGSIVLFENGSIIPHSLNVMMENGTGTPTWYGIDLGTGLASTHSYYVSDTSGGAVTRKLTFTNGILTSQT